jgi:glycosyltransferase involved in cell wall biosynthesis/O-antigen/teichoic acid export membrane protein
LFLVALGLLNGSNYIFHIVVSRLLGPSAYGALAALLAVVLVLSVPFSVLQTALAEKAASLGNESDVRLAAGALRTVVPAGLAAGLLVLFVGTPLLSVFLHVSFASALLLAPFVAASVPVSVAYGILQGQQRFRALAAVMLANVCFRLIFGVALVWLGLGVPGALLGTVIATGLTIPLGCYAVGVDRAAWRASPRDFSLVRGGLRNALYGLTSFWILAEIDLALARHYLDPHVAGYYSSAGLVARALLFLPAAVGVVVFPRFIASRADAAAQLHWLRASVATVVGLGVVGTGLLVLLRDPLIATAFGHRYLPGAALLPLLAPAMAALAVVNVLAYFHIAAASRAYLLSLAAILAEVMAVAFFHESAREIAVVVLVVSLTVAVVQYQAALSICRWRPRPHGEAGAGAARGLWSPATLELSVVLPCHNAASGLRTVLTRLSERLEPVRHYEIIVVSDGSTDETVSVARSIGDGGLRVIEYPDRGGKGHALQLGLSEAQGRYVAFCDADGDIDAAAIEPFLALMQLYEPDIVLGSKRHPLSDVYYPPLRRLLSWVYHKLTRALFRVNVSDTQTGFKLIRRDVLAAVLPRLLEKRYAFDLEFLVVARRLGFKRVFEAPVRIRYRFASQVNPVATIAILRDTLAIFYRHYLLNTYVEAAPCADGRENTVDAELLAAAQRRSRATRRRAGDQARILLLNWRDVEHPEAGGAEMFSHEIARRWVKEGHEVTLLASGFPGAASMAEIDGVRVRRFGRLRSGSFHALVQRELARAHGYDAVVESINTIPYLTPMWRRRLPPTLALIHQLAADVWDAELPKPFARIGRGVEQLLLRTYRNARVVAVSESTRTDLLGLGFTDVCVVPPGRDEPPDLRGFAKEPTPTFLFVGRLAANKRPDHAVEAFKTIKRTLPSAQLWIVGTGPLEGALASTAPDGVTLLGRLPRAELFERMARAHVLLVPSVREGWGLVVIEANSVGTPAVGYDVPGLRDSIRRGLTGFLVPGGDAAALGAQAASFVADANRYPSTRLLAIEWAKGFSWDRTAAELLSLVYAGAAVDLSPQLEDAVATSGAL